MTSTAGPSDLLARNRTWAERAVAADPDYFARHVPGQQPSLLYIGCSDSRVPPEAAMGAGPGEVFVHRNVANLVAEDDPAARAVVVYAVTVLGVGHVVVSGHHGCGGVEAASRPLDSGPLAAWLAPVRVLARRHAEELDAIADTDERLGRLVELNVAAQCRSLLGMPEVSDAVARGGLELHGWVYVLGEGRFRDLGFDAAMGGPAAGG